MTTRDRSTKPWHYGINTNVPYRSVLKTDPVTVNGRACWAEMWTFAADDDVFDGDTEKLADFSCVVDGFVCGSMRGHCSLNKYITMFGGIDWEAKVKQADESWFSPERIAESEERLAEERADLDARIAKMRKAAP